MNTNDISDYEDLARHLCGKDDGDENADIDEALLEKFEVDLGQFSTLVDALMPLCAYGRSPMSGATYQGFATDDGKNFTFLIKRTRQSMGD